MSLQSDVPNGDDILWVKFFDKPVQNGFRSKAEGRPCFDSVTYVSIIVPGDPNNKIETKATEDHKQRFPKQWANFKNNLTEKVDGTPIEQWPVLTSAQAEEFKYLGVRTIEQLAGASDAQMQKMMGGPSFRERAKAFLKVAKDSAEAQRLADANAELQAQIDSLKAQIAALGAIKPAETAVKSEPQTQAIPAPKRRGRPPKVRPEQVQGDSQ